MVRENLRQAFQVFITKPGDTFYRMDQSSVIGKMAGGIFDNVKASVLDLGDLDSSDDARLLAKSRIRTKHSTPSPRPLCRRPADQDGNARRIQFFFRRPQFQICGSA